MLQIGLQVILKGLQAPTSGDAEIPRIQNIGASSDDVRPDASDINGPFLFFFSSLIDSCMSNYNVSFQTHNKILRFLIRLFIIVSVPHC